MSLVSPYHTQTEEEPGQRDVHHNQDDCRYGLRIKPENKLQGTGGKPICKECAPFG